MKRVVVVVVVDVEGAVEAPAMTLTDPARPNSESGEVTVASEKDCLNPFSVLAHATTYYLIITLFLKPWVNLLS